MILVRSGQRRGEAMIDSTAAGAGSAQAIRAMIAARLKQREDDRAAAQTAEMRAYSQTEKQRLTDVRRALSIGITV